MFSGSLADLLSSVVVVVLVGFAGIGCFAYDAIRREQGASPGIAYRWCGVALTVAFIALVTLRFNTLAA